MSKFKRIFAKYRSYPSLILLGLAIVILMNYPSLKTPATIMLVVALVYSVIVAIPDVAFSKGIRISQKKSENAIQEALPYYEKAAKWGLRPQQELMLGTLHMQYGDKEKGKALLEAHIHDKDFKVRNGAKISLSMYYWMDRDFQSAIKLCKEAYDDGYKDKNLFVNFCTYLLEAGEEEEYRKYYRDAISSKMSVPAMKDLEAAYNIKHGDYQKAREFLISVFEQVDPAFLDPYLHFALVNLHFGDWETAVMWLEKIGANCHYTNTSIFTKEEIAKIIAMVKDEEYRWGLLKAVEEDPMAFIIGYLPEIEKGIQKPECLEILEETPSKEENLSEEEETTSKDEDREFSTDLTYDDEEWIKKHS